MKSKLLIYFLPVLLVTFLIYGYSTQDNPNADTAPVTDAGLNYSPVNSIPGDTLYTFTVPNQLILGVNKLANSPRFAFTSGGQSSAVTTDNIWIRTDLHGNRIDSFPQVGNTAGQGFGFRDLTWDGKYLLTSDNNQIRRIDTVTFTEPIPRFTGPNNPNRGLAWSSTNRIWTSNFTTGPVAMIDTNGATIKSLGIPTVAPYGLGADKWTSPGKMWLWYTQPSLAGSIILSKIDTANGTIVQSYTYSTLFPATATVGGLDVFNNHPEYPGRVVAAMVVQSSPASKLVVIDLGPDSTVTPPIGGNTLVLVHDTTITSTTQRKADRDTLNRYLPGLVGNYTIKGFDATSVFPDLNNYNTIILQETSFDAVAVRYLGATERDQIKTWLAAGTGSNKRSLISIGADQGYNYSRATSPAQDLPFAETYCKMIYRVDNAAVSNPIVEGVSIDVGNQRPLTTAPAGGSYWPDGASVVAGGSSVLYRYLNHTVNDTVAAIGNIQPGFVVATILQDPRYYTGGFGNVFAATIGWVVANGGIITGTGNTSTLTVPDNFNLSQNYPNPFNPTTKINFTIPNSGLVTLKVYNVLGKEVVSLINEVKTSGRYEVQFDGSNLSSGTYFYRLESGKFVETKKMLLVK